MAVELTHQQEMVFRYLIGRKTWSTVKQIAKHFIMSQSQARNLLDKLVELQVVDVFKANRVNHYRIKE